MYNTAALNSQNVETCIYAQWPKISIYNDYALRSQSTMIRHLANSLSTPRNRVELFMCL